MLCLEYIFLAQQTLSQWWWKTHWIVDADTSILHRLNFWWFLVDFWQSWLFFSQQQDIVCFPYTFCLGFFEQFNLGPVTVWKKLQQTLLTCSNQQNNFSDQGWAPWTLPLWCLCLSEGEAGPRKVSSCYKSESFRWSWQAMLQMQCSSLLVDLYQMDFNHMFVLAIGSGYSINFFFSI